MFRLLIFANFSKLQSTFQSLCPSKRETVFLNLDPEYEYRPDYYEEVRCANGMVHNENKIQAAVSAQFGQFSHVLPPTQYIICVILISGVHRSGFLMHSTECNNISNSSSTIGKLLGDRNSCSAERMRLYVAQTSTWWYYGPPLDSKFRDKIVFIYCFLFG